jgi:aminotransferase
MKPRWKHILSERVTELPYSEFEEIMRLAKEDPSVISLGPGEPDFNSPKPVVNATKKALDEGKTHYSSIGGLPALKEAIGKKLKKENKIPVNDSQKEIVITSGSTEALLLGLMSMVDAGEEVIVPNPSFLAYTPMVDLVTGFAVPLNLNHKDGFQIHAEEIKKLITNKTRCMIINTPANPTGTVLKKKFMEEIADVAVEHDLIIFSDEAYEKLVFGKGKHISFASLNGMFDHILTFQSFSKSYAMPGFRIGYASGHKELIHEMSKIHIYTSLTAGTSSQYGAIKALSLNQSYVEKMRKSYSKRRNLCLKLIKELETLEVKVAPEGAFYLFPRITTSQKSTDYVHEVLKEAKVVLVPGTEFGKNGEGFIRISYATSTKQINEAFKRMKEAGF